MRTPRCDVRWPSGSASLLHPFLLAHMPPNASPPPHSDSDAASPYFYFRRIPQGRADCHTLQYLVT